MAKADSRKVLAELKAHLKKGAPADMRRAFARDPNRFAKFSASRTTCCSTIRNARSTPAR